MQIVNKPPKSGKTEELINLSAEHGGHIVCPSSADAVRIGALAKELGLTVPLPWTFAEFLMQKHSPTKRVYIDDLEACLHRFNPSPIKAITVQAERKQGE